MMNKARFSVLASVFAVCIAFAVLVSPPSAKAQESVLARSALSGEEIALQDGRILRLSGIKAVSSEAHAFIESEIKDKRLVLNSPTIDRYGRTDATMSEEKGGVVLQESLLRAGLAFVCPTTDEKMSEDWLSVENEARKARRGYWSSHKDIETKDAKNFIGQYGFVAGIAAKAERIKNKAYISFGDAARPDFRIIIAARFLRPMKKLGLDALSSQGMHLRVRGWIRSGKSGAEIIVNDANQIEIEDKRF